MRHQNTPNDQANQASDTSQESLRMVDPNFLDDFEDEALPERQPECDGETGCGICE